jgi:hypothetical protein
MAQEERSQDGLSGPPVPWRLHGTLRLAVNRPNWRLAPVTSLKINPGRGEASCA